MLSLLATVFLCAVVPAQRDSAPPASGSVRVALLLRADEVASLDAAGFHGHSHDVLRRGRMALAHVIVPEADLPRLRAAFPHAPLQVVERSRPYREIVAELRRLAPDAPDPNYKTPAEIVAALQALEQQYPTLCKVYDLQSRYGAPLTHEGRRIFVLRVSDRPAADEDEPNVLVLANNHARELNSIEVPLLAAERLLAGHATDPTLRRLVDENQIWIVPTMNPDGLEFVWTTNNLWRKNRRVNGGGTYGVDLNRNYPFYWGQCGASTSPGSDTYQGPAAASEPETQAMLAFARAEVFERVIDFHSYAREVRSPFNPVVRGAVPPAITTYFAGVHQGIATGMNYAATATCCCGTHMEWHNSLWGTLAFLVEMGTAFQPAWAETQVELARVWPGLVDFLVQPAPLRGHVRSLAGSAPLAAELTVAGQVFQHGQKIQSGGPHGGYALFLAPGAYDVTFTAPGHVPKTVRAVITAGQTASLDVELLPVLAPTLLRADGSGRLGTPVIFTVTSPDDPGRGFFVPCALGDAPPIALGPRWLPLRAPLLIDLQLNAPGVFVNFLGTLDAAGAATATLHVPPLSVLVGLQLWFAAVTFADDWPLGVKGISTSVAITLHN